MVTRCRCDLCRDAWITDLIVYAATLERLALAAFHALDRGDTRGFEMVEEAATMATERDLGGEMDEAEVQDAARRVEALRAAGRLH